MYTNTNTNTNNTNICSLCGCAESLHSRNCENNVNRIIQMNLPITPPRVSLRERPNILSRSRNPGEKRMRSCSGCFKFGHLSNVCKYIPTPNPELSNKFECGIKERIEKIDNMDDFLNNKKIEISHMIDHLSRPLPIVMYEYYGNILYRIIDEIISDDFKYETLVSLSNSQSILKIIDYEGLSLHMYITNNIYSEIYFYHMQEQKEKTFLKLKILSTKMNDDNFIIDELYIVKLYIKDAEESYDDLFDKIKDKISKLKVISNFIDSRYSINSYIRKLLDINSMSNKIIVYRDIERLELSELSECPICYETKDLCYTSCNHGFCNSCIGTLISNPNNKNTNCPMCREEIFELYTRNIENSYDIIYIGNFEKIKF